MLDRKKYFRCQIVIFIVLLFGCIFDSGIAILNNDGLNQASPSAAGAGQESVRWLNLQQRNSNNNEQQRKIADYGQNRDQLTSSSSSNGNYPYIIRESNKETVRTEIRFHGPGHIDQSQRYNNGGRGGTYVDYNNDPLPLISASHQQQQQQQPQRPKQQPAVVQKNENDRGGTTNSKSSLCSPNGTGQFPYKSDCRKFINCWKGHGYIQTCSPGTLFNSETLECDFANKAKCIYNDVPDEYETGDTNVYNVALDQTGSYGPTRTNPAIPTQSFGYNNNNNGQQPFSSSATKPHHYIANHISPIITEEGSSSHVWYPNPNYNPSNVVPISSFQSDHNLRRDQWSSPPAADRNPNANVYRVLSQNFQTTNSKKQPPAANYVASSVRIASNPVSPYNWTKPLFIPTNTFAGGPLNNGDRYSNSNNNNNNNNNNNRPPINYNNYPAVENSAYPVYHHHQQNADNNKIPAFENVNQQFHVAITDEENRSSANNNNNGQKTVTTTTKQKLTPEVRSSFEDDVKCPPGFSGIIAHATDCAKYLNCDRGRTFVMDCGPGTLFNPAYSVCDFPFNVKCDKDDGEVSGSGKLMVRMPPEDPPQIEDRFRKSENNDNDQVTWFNTVATAKSSIAAVVTANIIPRESSATTVNGKTGKLLPTASSSAGAGKSLISRGDTNIEFTTLYPLYTVSSSYNQLPNYQPAYNVYPDIEPPIVSFTTTTTTTTASKSGGTVTKVPSTTSRSVMTTTNKQNRPANPDTQYDPVNMHSYYDPALINVDSGNVLLNPDNLSKPIDLNAITKEDCSRRPTVRLRGGPSTSEGFLQIEVAPHRWGVVCDEPNKWTVAKANIVCADLGYERGVEQTWQGWPSIVPIDNTYFSNIAANRVDCVGNEHSFLNCTFKKETVCDVESNAVWIRCIKNPASQCHLNEVSFNNTCYRLIIPNEGVARHDSLIGFSKEEAIKHCSSIGGGKLLDILTQKENDFVSEWLINQNFMSNIMTSGVGFSVFGMPVWIWEGTAHSLIHQNWWPGWKNNTKVMTPIVPTNRAMCVILQRHFPCSSETNDSICDVNYFYWNTIDCGNMSSKHPYICERPADNIGCVDGNGANYVGTANVTAYNSGCLSWNSSLVLSALKYKISEKTRSTYLNNHNYCRNPDGTELFPWCYIQTSDNGIQKEFCDIPGCDKSNAEAAIITSRMIQSCQQGFFQCTPNECIGNSQVCDGYTDCSNGADEHNCKSNPLERFVVRPHSYISANGRDYQRKYTNTSLKTCAEICLETVAFSCQSFSHIDSEKICLITDATESTKGVTLLIDSAWNYYKLKKPDITCRDMFLCNNGLCIENSNVCNGRNDCGDRTDEKNCSKSSIGYDIRLIGGNSTHEGHVQVKVLGEWGYVCDDMFDTNDGEVVCRELGYAGGVFEVKPHSYYSEINTTVENPIVFLLDNLQCFGNESSLTECNFSEWGSHDCSPEEIAGVVCHVAGDKKCNSESFQCITSEECIPLIFLCDTVADCSDGSDEDAVRCNTAVEVRLHSDDERKSGAVFEGRVEVRRFGIWGTVCDDDFGANEAAVVCHSIGFHGPSQALKEAAFGPGDGQIWLDQVHCNGTELSLTECLHSKWGHHNCKHEEDVSVICSPQTSTVTSKPSAELVLASKPVSLPKLEFIKPEQCGSVYVHKQKPFIQGRVVSGYSTIKGALPWQASVRLRTSSKSEHWCGAVIITKHHVLTAAHCLQGYSKDFYFVRVGDYDTEVKEEHEQEFNIAEFYQHDSFDEGYKLNNDLALIKLKGSTGIYFNDYVQPICLPTSDLDYKDGLNCSISGWGSDATPGSGYARLLRMAWVPILSQEVCVAKYIYGNMSLSDGMYCAGHLQGGPDSCQGDSGGPMICPAKDNKFILYGITSWGHGCGRPNKPGVYTKVAHYLKWIENQLIHSSIDLPVVIPKQNSSTDKMQ